MANLNVLKKIGRNFLIEATKQKYSYHFTWLGRPIIQYPQDIMAMQEIIWSVKPDIIIETGVAHGGSLIFYASMLHLLNNHGSVIGIELELRPHNRHAILSHPLNQYIKLIDGSSTDQKVIAEVQKIIMGHTRVLVTLDSNHTHQHVLSELHVYAPLVTKGSYIVVFDTDIEILPKKLLGNRLWGEGNSPKTAVDAFLKENKHFMVDRTIDDKLCLSVAPGGYLKRIS